MATTVVAVVAVVGVDAELADDLEGVFAPVGDVDEREVERGAVVADEAAAVAERVGGGENVGSDDFLEQALEFVIRQADVVERVELLAEVLLQGGPVADVGAVFILQGEKFLDQPSFELGFGRKHCKPLTDSVTLSAWAELPGLGVYQRLPGGDRRGPDLAFQHANSTLRDGYRRSEGGPLHEQYRLLILREHFERRQPENCRLMKPKHSPAKPPAK